MAFGGNIFSEETGEFLDFYGGKFSTTTTGIQMNPPLYFAGKAMRII